MSWRVRLATLALAGASTSIAACRADEGRAYACTCSWLTDFDDEGKMDVVTCAPSAETAPEHAKNCAASAPAPVARCTCRPIAGAPPCREACPVPPP